MNSDLLKGHQTQCKHCHGNTKHLLNLTVIGIFDTANILILG